ncbi:MAG: hypothetical protein JOZ42_04840 [Acetobacteraceae bacterium]|nr:hypothetical protein [Acetobacteraceae bacterium]
MIRPVTCVCALLAGASGLYLYQSKHRVQLLDRQIESTVRETQAARERTGVLRAEWTLRNDPERLEQLASRFMQLKTVTPGQFTTLADLGNRLPPVRAPEAEPAPDALPQEAPQDAIPLTADAAPATPTQAAPAPAQPAPVQVASPAAQKPDATRVAPKSVAVAKLEPAKPEPAKPERPPERRPAQLALASVPLAAPRVVTHSVIGGGPAPVPLARPISVALVQPSRVRAARPPETPAFVGSSLITHTALAPPVPVPAYNEPNGN